MIYLDSCALVKLIVAEKETPALEAYLAGRRSQMLSCQLALTEVVRVVRRSCHDAQRRLVVEPVVRDERLAAATRLLDRIDLLVVDRPVFTAAAVYDDDPHVGSLDAIHLVCAREVGETLTDFITYDKTLARAVTAAGLPLAQPA